VNVYVSSCLFSLFFRVQWLDEDKDSIKMSSDYEIVEAVAIATQNNSVLEVQVAASGDLSVVSVPQGDSEVEDWVVVYDYPKHTEIEAGLQEHAAKRKRKKRKTAKNSIFALLSSLSSRRSESVVLTETCLWMS